MHNKILVYLGHAGDCNAMALNAASEEHRKLLLEMANTWTTLAREHSRMTGQPLSDAKAQGGDPAPALTPSPPTNIKPWPQPAATPTEARS